MADVVHTGLVDRLRQRLIERANTAGGWGYYPEKTSRVEPTCWSLIALEATWSETDQSWRSFAEPHLRFLAACQRSNGLLTDSEDALANFSAEGLSACGLAHLQSADAPLVRKLLGGIAGTKGVALPKGEVQDSSLQGWPWIIDTFSWVEPTSWCALALKKAGSMDAGAAARIREAEKLLADRVCRSGGWNYGNAEVFGQDLRAYVPTTAVGLLAMQDQPSNVATVRSLEFLKANRLKERSGMALGLAALSLHIYGQPTADVEDALALWLEPIDRHTNLQTLATALYALTTSRHDVKAFRVAH